MSTIQRLCNHLGIAVRRATMIWHYKKHPKFGETKWAFWRLIYVSPNQHFDNVVEQVGQKHLSPTPAGLYWLCGSGDVGYWMTLWLASNGPEDKQ